MSVPSTPPLVPARSQSWLSAFVCAAVGLTVGGLLLASTALANRHVRSHPKRFGLEKTARDARQVLVEHLMYSPAACEADSVLIGSSRMRVAGDVIVGGERFVNLSVPGMRPAEFGAYLDLFERTCHKTPRTVVLGLDFFGSSTYYVSTPQPPSYYIDKTGNPTYRLGLYDDLSISATERAWDLWWDYPRRKHFSEKRLEETLKPNKWRQRRATKEADRLAYRKAYVRDANAHCLTPRIYEATKIGRADSTARYPHRRYYEEAYGEYFFDPKVKQVLRQLHDDHDDSRMVVLLTPTSHIIYDALVSHGLSEQLAAYEALIGEEFDEAYSFMGPDAVSSERRNFQDDNHLTKPAMDVMLRRVLGEEVGPVSFGRNISGVPLEALQRTHEAFASASRVPRSRRHPAPPRTVRYDALSARPRVEHTLADDCTVVIKPGEHLDVTMTQTSHARSLEIMASRKTPMRVEFLAGSSSRGSVNIPKVDTPVVGLRTRVVDVPTKTQAAGYDTLRIHNGANTTKAAVAYLAVHDTSLKPAATDLSDNGPPAQDETSTDGGDSDSGR